MGEKERGTLEEEERQTQQSSFGERAARPREAGSQREGGSGPSDAAETAIVKSKSNITNNREAAPDDSGSPGEGGPLEATNLNSSRSNTYRTAAPGGDDDGSPEERASNLNLSKSNINRTGGPAAGGGESGLAIGDQGAVEPEKKPRPK